MLHRKDVRTFERPQWLPSPSSILQYDRSAEDSHRSATTVHIDMEPLYRRAERLPGRERLPEYIGSSSAHDLRSVHPPVFPGYSAHSRAHPGSPYTDHNAHGPATHASYASQSQSQSHSMTGHGRPAERPVLHRDQREYWKAPPSGPPRPSHPSPPFPTPQLSPYAHSTEPVNNYWDSRPQAPDTNSSWTPLYSPHREGLVSRNDFQRKRLRNSRSCAECQRRKTRCDATGAFVGESHSPANAGSSRGYATPEEDMVVVQPCTNCVRGGIPCHYSRRPAKRGPLKSFSSDASSVEGAPQRSKHSVVPESEGSRESERQKRESTPRDLLESSRPCRPWEEPRLSPRPGVLAVQAQSSSPQSPSPPTEMDGRREKEDERLQAGFLVSDGGEDSVISVPSHRMKRKRCSRAGSPASSTALHRRFVLSSVNATFGIRPFLPSTSTSTAGGLDQRLVQRAMQLILEPVVAPSVSEDSNATEKPHALRLARAQAQALAGLKCNGAEGSITAGTSSVASVRALRNLNAATAALESDALLICYLDALRHGNPDNSTLAAAAAKLFPSARANTDRDDDQFRRSSVLFSADRWHAFAFNTPFVVPCPMLPDILKPSGLAKAIGSMRHAPLKSAPTEILRAALMFSSLIDLAQTAGGWKNVTTADCESVLHCHSSETDGADVVGEDGENTPDPSTGSDVGIEASLYSVQALQTSLCGTVRLYHRMQTAPAATNVTVKSIANMIEALESCLLSDPGRTPPDPKTLLMRSFIGPYVFALAATTVMWLSRAIAIASKRAHLALQGGNEAVASELTTLEYLRKTTTDYSRLIGPLCFFAASSSTTDHSAPEGVRPLYLRIASFNHSTVSYLTALGDVSLCLRGDFESEDRAVKAGVNEDSPLYDSERVLQNEVDGQAALLSEAGPLGVILLSTTNAEAWDSLTGNRSANAA